MHRPYIVAVFDKHHPYLDFITTSTIATSIVHSKLDYSNPLLPGPRILSRDMYFQN